MGLSRDFPPYHYKDANNTWRGVTVELASTLTRLANCDLTFADLPWARSVKLLESGEIQLISHFTYTEERAAYTQFLGPHLIEKIAFVANKDRDINVTNVATLPQFNGGIGLTRGDKFGEEFDYYVRNNPLVNTKLVEIKNNQDRLSMLVKGRLHGMFVDERSALHLLESAAGLKNQYGIRFTLQGNPVYWGVNFRVVPKEVRKALNRGWQTMLEKNLIAPVYQKYALSFDMQQLQQFPLKTLDQE